MTIQAPPDIDPGDWGIAWSDLLNAPAVADEPTRDRLLAVAIAVIWHLTGRRLGIHTETDVLPLLYPRRCGADWPGAFSGFWYDAIDLDPGDMSPVVAVLEVIENGAALDLATQVGVVNNRWLVRTPSGTRFPQLQDIAATGTDRILALSFQHGLTPDADATWAVGRLVGQLWAAISGAECSLDPSVVQSVQREGISFALISPGGAWENGYTGDAMVDAACKRSWPLGPACQIVPGFFDPAAPTTRMVRFDRPG